MEWHELVGAVGVNNIVYALTAIGTYLYAGGDFSTAGGVLVNFIAKWNGTSWSALGSGVNNTVHALTVMGTDLYAGGVLSEAGGTPANSIAKWNGTSWSALGSGVNNTVLALTVMGTDLYVAGFFTTAGGAAANRIAKWNGTSWSALGSGVNNGVYTLAITGTDLYVGGGFTTAGVTAADNIAKWREGGLCPTYYRDMDGDGFGNAAMTLQACSQPADYVTNNTDCNDANAAINPAATEVCDHIDNNCNGSIDDISGNTPGAWASGSVGSAGVSASFPPCFAAPNDLFTLQANGFSTSSSDQLQAVYQQICGNGEIIARILSVQQGGWGGVMIRENLMPGAKKASLKTQLNSLIRREIRAVTNGAASILNFNRPQHVWLRLVRSGGTFTGYTSTNGTTWSFAFTTTVSMAGCVYVGVFSESINAATTTTATFANVSVTGVQGQFSRRLARCESSV